VSGESEPSDGDVRFSEAGEVEVFNAETGTWEPYTRLPEPPGPIIRDGE
jgi:hypothetical protein